MNKKELKNLKTGDIVRSKLNNISYMIHANYGNRCTAVKTVDITNPTEWNIVFKAIHKKYREALNNKKLKHNKTTVK